MHITDSNITENINNQKPCLVSASQGFSVQYQQKYLYSKYNPQRTILSQIEQLNILPGTLILCCSPVLNYGLTELSDKLGENCFMLGIELEEDLQNFILSEKQTSTLKNGALQQENCSTANFKSPNFAFLTKNEALNLPETLLQRNLTFACGASLPAPGTFKRVISINFSAGASFNETLYNRLTSFCANAVMTFWKNRITLVKFGRKYCQDLFCNLKNLPFSTPIASFFTTVEKPIIVFGSGESLEQGIKDVKLSKNEFYILCADTALQPLLENHIKVDGVFIEEAQNVILQAFTGTQGFNFQIFAGLSSLPQIAGNFPVKQISYFMTEFTQAVFLDNLKESGILPPVNQPFGSVGLTAFYYALHFRKDDSVPVYCYGLDFAYTSYKTHAKGTLAHKTRLLQQNRLSGLSNPGAAFNVSCIPLGTKPPMYTSDILKNYANLFNYLFSDKKNVYKAALLSSLLNLQYKQLPQKEFCAKIKSGCFKTDEQTKIKVDSLQESYSNLKNKICSYFAQEKISLNQLKDILTGDTPLSKEDALMQIKKLAEQREYLYLHFPDGHQFSTSQNFLNRLRIQIDFFLKYFN